jgi:hypothetical protein
MVGIGSSDSYNIQDKEVLAWRSSTPDELTYRQMRRQLNYVNSLVRWKAMASSTE